MKLCKKTVLVTALFFVLAAVFVIASAAVAPAQNPSDEYILSPYYAQLQSVELTGDQRTDVVLVALSQLGYHEGDSDADMGGLSGGTRNFVEYNRLYGKVDNHEGNGVSYGYNWCCAFATWCVRTAGVPTSAVITEISCDRLVNWLKANSTYENRQGGYVPNTGDLIFFKSAGSQRQWASHIGIVRYCDGSKVYTVEGNTGSYNVALREYNIGDPYIVGYGVPDYISAPASAIDFSSHCPGTYFITVTTSALNVRKGPSTSYPVCGSLNYSDKVTVSEVENDWGKISLSGEDGWIYLGYAQYVPSAVYTIYYDSNGGSPAVLSTQPKHEGIATTLTDITPTKTDYVFAGWSTDPNAESAMYAPGAEFDINADTRLYAVWTVGEHKISFYNGDVKLQEGSYPEGVIVTQPVPPTKEPDEVFSYTFAGWDTGNDGKADILPKDSITSKEDIVCRAVFDKKYIDYTIKFTGYNDIVIDESKYHYGDAVRIPTVKNVIDGRYEYVFSGWDKNVRTNVDGNAGYKAVYKRQKAVFTVCFVDGNGNIVSESEYGYGDTVIVPAIIPTKQQDMKFTYKFSGWAPAIVPVTEDTVYTAQFDGTYIDYTVRFIDGDGKVIESSQYHFGDIPKLNYEGIISKTPDKMYEYTFAGWDKELVGIGRDTTFRALFKSVKREYNVTFFDHDGSVLKAARYHYGEAVELPSEPVREGYKFKEWSPTVTPVSGDMSFSATYVRQDAADGDKQDPATPDNPDTPDTPENPDIPGDNTKKAPVALIVSIVSVAVAGGGFAVFIIVKKKLKK